MPTPANRCLSCWQALDAAGKDGVIRHLFTGMNSEGTSAFGSNNRTSSELAHDFLWRAHLHAPGNGEVVIFNRSHYEDVLVVRVHKLVPRSVWSKRYDLINDVEKILAHHGTRILKFYLHISPEEQLASFKQRLDDKARNWKISESDYSERELWPKYVEAYEDAIAFTGTKYASWYVIPANHKWFRNLAVSQIIADTMEEMGLKLPPIARRHRRYSPEIPCGRGESSRQDVSKPAERQVVVVEASRQVNIWLFVSLRGSRPLG